MRCVRIVGLAGCLAALACGHVACTESDVARPQGQFEFDSLICEQVLDNYLSRAVSHQTLLTDDDAALLADDIRMFVHMGAKFVGRASIIWSTPADIEAHFARAAQIAAQVHAADADIVLQAGVFEIVDTGVNQIPVPEWAFEPFGQDVETRSFSYEAMLYPDHRLVDFWSAGASVPDLSQVETQMWLYYRARRYIDAGFEALHCGVVEFMSETDPDFVGLRTVLNAVREYAGAHARRHLILCDAHHRTGIVIDGQLLFDFVSYPCRVQEVAGQPTVGELVAGPEDSIYGRTLGGVTPSGWMAQRLPYLVEVDNWGSSGQGGQDIGGIWIWGYDEISWFARLSAEERNAWLEYAWDWVRANDPYGHFQFPTRRVLADPVEDTYYWYYANTPSAACQLGHGQEETIRAIWLASPVPAVL